MEAAVAQKGGLVPAAVGERKVAAGSVAAWEAREGVAAVAAVVVAVMVATAKEEGKGMAVVAASAGTCKQTGT